MSLPMVPHVAPVPAMSDKAIEAAREFEALCLQQEQVPIVTDHVLHGGMYARTILIPGGTVLTGALIKLPTMLVLHGDARVFVGDGTVDLVGYNVVPASKGRKQIFLARSDTFLTMVFPTQAKTIEEAEEEFTDEAALLLSRHGENHIRITGE